MTEEKIVLPPEFDRGPWVSGVNSGDGRVFVESDSFVRDARMYIDGDFGSADEKLAYASGIALQLNCAPIPRNTEIVGDTQEIQNYLPPLPPNLLWAIKDWMTLDFLKPEAHTEVIADLKNGIRDYALSAIEAYYVVARANNPIMTNAQFRDMCAKQQEEALAEWREPQSITSLMTSLNAEMSAILDAKETPAGGPL